MNYLLVIAVLLGVGGASFLVFRSPSFWIDLGTVALKALKPQIIKLFFTLSKPKDLTVKEKELISKGEQPNLKGENARPFGRQKGE
jgi:hypothetical protein